MSYKKKMTYKALENMLHDAVSDSVVECPICNHRLEPDYERCPTCKNKNPLKQLGLI